MSSYSRECRTTLEKVSTTLEALTQAFEVQWKKSNTAEAKLEKTLGHFNDLHKSLVLKDNMTIKLQDTNDQLRIKVKCIQYKLGSILCQGEQDLVIGIGFFGITVTRVH